PGENSIPVWSPDGSRVAFRSDRKHQSDLYVRATSGSSGDEALSDEPGQKVPQDWSRDGRFLVYFDRPATGNRVPRMSVFPMFGEPKSFVLYQLDGNPSPVGLARFSPDGRWVAFTTEESGRREVCAMSFPDRKRKVQISSAGGESPQWRA